MPGGFILKSGWESDLDLKNWLFSVLQCSVCSATLRLHLHGAPLANTTILVEISIFCN